MFYAREQARTSPFTAEKAAARSFGSQLRRCTDAEFCTGRRTRVLAVTGLPFAAPVCAHLMNDPACAKAIARTAGDVLLVYSADGTVAAAAPAGFALGQKEAAAAVRVIARVLRSPGTLNGRGEQVLDLKSCPVGPHYSVNLLLGWRGGYADPLFTTPKSAVDAFGRGSFRAGGAAQVLASRCVLQPEENGEPVNRQFYLTEDGREIFYSLDVRRNVKSAVCTHSQNRTEIRYETEDGLVITRTIFLLPQADGMPDAVEVQRVRVENRSERARALSIVLTGEFGIAGPETVANDVVYANLVQESEVEYAADGSPVCLTMHHKPADQQGEKKFALLLSEGETMDAFSASLPDFIGTGTLAEPEQVLALPSRPGRKMVPFFAMSKAFSLAPGAARNVDTFVGMMDRSGDVSEAFDAALHTLTETYCKPGALEAALGRVKQFWADYTASLTPETGDAAFDAYAGQNLPFQVLYQTFVSRAFAWTQKSYRETGFREIQDVFASLPYLVSAGMGDLARALISQWAKNVFRMGYAYHDFTYRGKEPGDCSDDSLWLVQAVYRYIQLTGDDDFLTAPLPVAGEAGSRPLIETLQAILTYSGCISVGVHGLPLLDKADWNDTLRLDKEVMKGPAKEACYRRQLADRGQEWGAPLENTLTESVMNACLAKIAADETAALYTRLGRIADAGRAAELAARLADNMQKYAWKGDFFARALINDGRAGGYTYLGAGRDGLSTDPAVDGTYFLNSFGWAILAHVATEPQIGVMLDRVERYLKTDAGLRLCTLVQYERLGCNTATSLYFAGDRENGGVFKHAAMMSTAAALEAAKTVQDPALARRLADLAYFMIGKTLPYKTLEHPFITKGNPRFCTQYNNSETGENIGPMLSGTASWLTLALFAAAGIDRTPAGLLVEPVLPAGRDTLCYTLRRDGTVLHVAIHGDPEHFRAGTHTRRLLDGAPADGRISLPADGRQHTLTVNL